MAKKEERTPLKKGRAMFNIIGEVKVNDFTFKMENEYDSGWTDNQMNLGIDCGNGNVVYSEMRGGFFPGRDNVIYVRGVKDQDGKTVDDWDNQFTIDWDDRHDEDILETVGKSCFLTVGIEQDSKGKTFYKDFLSAYDAVEYLQEHLDDGTAVNVKGNIKYNEFDDKIYAKKEITSIVLSKKPPEEYRATFVQTILLDAESIGKKDKEKNVVYLDAFVVDYVGKVQNEDGDRVEIKQNVMFPYQFEVGINDENPEITSKMLKKLFKVSKKGNITEMTVTGNIIEGQAIVNLSDDDIPDDIKELIEMGIYTDEEVKNSPVVGNKNREKRLVIHRPIFASEGEGENRKAKVAIDVEKYKESDKVFLSQLLEQIEAEAEDDAGGGAEDKKSSKPTKKKKRDDDEDDNEDDEDDFLKLLEEID